MFAYFESPRYTLLKTLPGLEWTNKFTKKYLIFVKEYFCISYKERLSLEVSVLIPRVVWVSKRRHFTGDMWLVTCDRLHVTVNLSHVTCKVSPVPNCNNLRNGYRHFQAQATGWSIRTVTYNMSLTHWKTPKQNQ